MAPKIAPFSFGDEAILSGSPTQVTCLVSEGDLPMDVQWHFRGSNASSAGLGMTTTKVGSRTNLLVIDSVTPFNGGLYTCRASNAAGIAEYSAQLFVQGTFKDPNHPPRSLFKPSEGFSATSRASKVVSSGFRMCFS